MTRFKVGDLVKPNPTSPFWSSMLHSAVMRGIVVTAAEGSWVARVEWDSRYITPHFEGELLPAENGLDVMLRTSFGD